MQRLLVLILAVLAILIAVLLCRRAKPAVPPPEPPVSSAKPVPLIPDDRSDAPPPPEEPEISADGPPLEPEAAGPFVISLLGDCTLTSSHYAGYFESVVGDRLDYPFAKVADTLSRDDLTIANLECSFSDRRLESSSEYAFCGQPKYAQSLLLGGVDCVTMANNHTYDFGAEGVADTATVLEGISLPGIQGNRRQCFDLTREDGTSLRVGIFVSAFSGTPQQMQKGCAALREDGAQLVIACMHAGAERIYVPTQRQTALAHAAVNGGADVVVGTHPHILQPVEHYKDGVILYSIGNFCFGGNRSPADPDTVIAQIVAEPTEDGLSWHMEYVPCSITGTPKSNDYQPTPYAPGSEAYLRCLQKLESPWDTTTAEEAARARGEAQTER